MALPLVVDSSACASFNSDDYLLIKSGTGEVLGYALVRSGGLAENNHTQLEVTANLNPESGLYFALAEGEAAGGNLEVAFTENLVNGCPGTQPEVSRQKLTADCSKRRITRTFDVPPLLFNCSANGVSGFDDFFRVFFLQIGMALSPAPCASASQQLWAGAEANQLSASCSFATVTGSCRPSTCPGAEALLAEQAAANGDVAVTTTVTTRSSVTRTVVPAVVGAVTGLILAILLVAAAMTVQKRRREARRLALRKKLRSERSGGSLLGAPADDSSCTDSSDGEAGHGQVAASGMSAASGAFGRQHRRRHRRESLAPFAFDPTSPSPRSRHLRLYSTATTATTAANQRTGAASGPLPAAASTPRTPGRDAYAVHWQTAPRAFLEDADALTSRRLQHANEASSGLVLPPPSQGVHFFSANPGSAAATPTGSTTGGHYCSLVASPSAASPRRAVYVHGRMLELPEGSVPVDRGTTGRAYGVPNSPAMSSMPSYIAKAPGSSIFPPFSGASFAGSVLGSPDARHVGRAQWPSLTAGSVAGGHDSLRSPSMAPDSPGSMSGTISGAVGDPSLLPPVPAFGSPYLGPGLRSRFQTRLETIDSDRESTATNTSAAATPVAGATPPGAVTPTGQPAGQAPGAAAAAAAGLLAEIVARGGSAASAASSAAGGDVSAPGSAPGSFTGQRMPPLMGVATGAAAAASRSGPRVPSRFADVMRGLSSAQQTVQLGPISPGSRSALHQTSPEDSIRSRSRLAEYRPPALELTPVAAAAAEVTAAPATATAAGVAPASSPTALAPAHVPAEATLSGAFGSPAVPSASAALEASTAAAGSLPFEFGPMDSTPASPARSSAQQPYRGRRLSAPGAAAHLDLAAQVRVTLDAADVDGTDSEREDGAGRRTRSRSSRSRLAQRGLDALHQPLSSAAEGVLPPGAGSARLASRRACASAPGISSVAMAGVPGEAAGSPAVSVVLNHDEIQPEIQPDEPQAGAGGAEERHSPRSGARSPCSGASTPRSGAMTPEPAGAFPGGRFALAGMLRQALAARLGLGARRADAGSNAPSASGQGVTPARLAALAGAVAAGLGGAADAGAADGVRGDGGAAEVPTGPADGEEEPARVEAASSAGEAASANVEVAPAHVEVGSEGVEAASVGPEPEAAAAAVESAVAQEEAASGASEAAAEQEETAVGALGATTAPAAEPRIEEAESAHVDTAAAQSEVALDGAEAVTPQVETAAAHAGSASDAAEAKAEGPEAPGGQPPAACQMLPEQGS
ncbi:hypothetical protein HYH03_000129 [Edaphochlamys debaryana]|uniref:Uncharacterized protein n=1 Tax=Edaphochlamys debaryana TaxID=47281 RepID=A0A836C747_9CHLO|nr:hypothetical protein HYH03_000129 [Edaphochlamys debaryana]|eukprot:KAG2501624.1 hypothetical protein HYH03_000129 [Edaphochlamys debaryana]